MAWYTALAIAAAVPTMPISPMPLAPHRVEVRVVFVDPGRLDPEHVGMGGHVVLGQVVVEEAAAVLVDHGLLHQRHAQPHRHAADELGPGQRLVDYEAVPIERPASDAVGSALSPSSTRT